VEPRAPTYRPGTGVDTLLHRVVREPVDEFLQLTREQHDKPPPRCVVREFREYLRCGDLSVSSAPRARTAGTRCSCRSRVSGTGLRSAGTC